MQQRQQQDASSSFLSQKQLGSRVVSNKKGRFQNKVRVRSPFLFLFKTWITKADFSTGHLLFHF